MTRSLGLDIRLAGGSSAITSPKGLGSLIAWWRSDLGISQSGNVMSAWADQSASGFTLNAKSTTNFAGYAAAGGPKGLPRITFAGSQSIGNAGLNMGGIRAACTIFGCLAFTAASETAYGCYSNTNDPPIFLSNGGTRDFRLGADVTGGSCTTNFEVWVATCASGAQAFRLNGTQVGTGSNVVSNSAASVFYLGASSSGTQAMTGAWCELGYYSRVLSAGEIARLEAYLRARYKLW